MNKEPRLITNTPNKGAMNFTILEEAFVIIIFMYLVYLPHIQEQRGRLLRYQCIFYFIFRTLPNTRTPDQGAIILLILKEAFIFIITIYLVQGLNTQMQRTIFSKR